MNKVGNRQIKTPQKREIATARCVPKFRKAKPGEGEKSATRYKALVDRIAKLNLPPFDAVTTIRADRDKE